MELRLESLLVEQLLKIHVCGDSRWTYLCILVLVHTDFILPLSKLILYSDVVLSREQDGLVEDLSWSKHCEWDVMADTLDFSLFLEQDHAFLNYQQIRCRTFLLKDRMFVFVDVLEEKFAIFPYVPSRVQNVHIRDACVEEMCFIVHHPLWIRYNNGVVNLDWSESE